MSTRGLQEIRADRQGTATLSDLASVLDAKLRPASRFGVTEYATVEDSRDQCSATFRSTGAVERGGIAEPLCGSRPRASRAAAVWLVDDDVEEENG